MHPWTFLHRYEGCAGALLFVLVGLGLVINAVLNLDYVYYIRPGSLDARSPVGRALMAFMGLIFLAAGSAWLWFGVKNS